MKLKSAPPPSPAAATTIKTSQKKPIWLNVPFLIIKVSINEMSNFTVHRFDGNGKY